MSREIAFRAWFHGQCALLAAVIAAVIAGVLGLAPAPASAQEGARAGEYLDHLTCFKVKADQKLKGSARLEIPIIGTQGLGFADECKIKKVAYLCLPTNKSNAQGEIKGEAVTVQDGAAWNRGMPQICYKVRCKEKPDVEVQLQDQFASYGLRKMKAKILCGPAVNPCEDPTRTVFAGGPNVGGQGGSCRQFTSQATCEQAWVASDEWVLIPQQCEWDGDTCRGAANLELDNTCVSCADESREQVDDCEQFEETSQGTCESFYEIGGTGATACVWNPSNGDCRPCGLTNELGLDNARAGFEGCTNVCRAPAPPQ